MVNATRYIRIALSQRFETDDVCHKRRYGGRVRETQKVDGQGSPATEPQKHERFDAAGGLD